MAKNRTTTSRRKPNKTNPIYFFLIPALFLAIYLAGQPQSYIQEASSDKEKKAEEIAPTFTQIGDCVANNNCPPTEPPAVVNEQHKEKKETKTKKDSKKEPKQESKKETRAELIARVNELLKQLTDNKCGKVNEKRWHRRDKWKKKNRGLLKLLRCLEKELEHQEKPAGGQTGQQPSIPPQDLPEPQEEQEELPQEEPEISLPSQEPPVQLPAVGAANVVSGQCGTVISKAQQLNDVLQIGPANGNWSKIAQTFSDCGYTSKTWSGSNDATKYWCTYLIVDAYNLAGFKGLSVGAHAAVVNMRSWWKTASGYKYVENLNDKATMDKIGPGYAIFMETQAGVFTGKEHVNFIKIKNVDDRGNGTITTLDSNAKVKGRTYTVTNWKLTGTSYPVRGYGGR